MLDVDKEIRRATSPLVGFVESDESSDEKLAVSSTSPLHERFAPSFVNDGAARTLQQWMRNYRRVVNAATELSRPHFISAGKCLFGDASNGGLAALLNDATSTNEAMSIMSSTSMARDATTVLMGLPRDSKLRKMPVALHGPRAFLSAALVMSKPAVVLGDHVDTAEGRALINASRMVISACRRLMDLLLEATPAPAPVAVDAVPVPVPPSVPVDAPDLGWLRRFRARLIMVRFARRYHAASFGAWRTYDAQRVAATLIGPYAECFDACLQAELSNDAPLAASATSRASQIREKIAELIGPEAATSKLEEVEAGVRVQVIAASQTRECMESTGSFTTDAITLAVPKPKRKPSSSGLKRGFLNFSSSSDSANSGAKPASPPLLVAACASPSPKGDPALSPPPSQEPDSKSMPFEGGASIRGAPSSNPHLELGESTSTPPSSAALEQALVNEQYAHELIMDENFQLPQLEEPEEFYPPSATDFVADRGIDSTVDGAEGGQAKGRVNAHEAMERVQKTMQAIFWQRLLTSLTPTMQNDRDDVLVGSAVQARYGGPQGAFYAAEVTAVNDDDTFDIRYEEDGVTEQGCQLSQFRLASERVDARPLLTLIDEVRERLERATPRRSDLHARYREVLDAPWLTKMLKDGSLELASMVRFAHFILDSVEGLEAPARAERTRRFKAAFTEYVLTRPHHPQGGTLTGGGGVLVQDSTPFVAALPQLFTFLHAALDQLQRDTVNWQLSIIAPRLQGSAGVAYERERFQQKVDRGITTLQKTARWIGDATKSFVEAADYEERRRYVAAEASLPTSTASRQIYEQCFVHALLELLRKDIRWDSDAAAQMIPETLILDAPRLAKVRDSIDRAVLVSTLIVFLRQVLAKRRVVPAPELLQELKKKLDFLMTQSDTRLPSLQLHVVEAAEMAARAHGTLFEADDITSLKKLVASAANSSNSVLLLFTKRAFALLQAMLLSCRLDDTPSISGTSGTEDELVGVQLNTGLKMSVRSSAAVLPDPRGRALERALDVNLRATGLSPFRSTILDAGRVIFRLAKHNFATFGPRYSCMCQSAAANLPRQSTTAKC